jgi:hypothetical protein
MGVTVAVGAVSTTGVLGMRRGVTDAGVGAGAEAGAIPTVNEPLEVLTGTDAYRGVNVGPGAIHWGAGTGGVAPGTVTVLARTRSGAAKKRFEELTIEAFEPHAADNAATPLEPVSGAVWLLRLEVRVERNCGGGFKTPG